VDLPETQSELLTNSPLILVAAQVTYEEVAWEVGHRQARDVQRRLGSDWTQLQSTPLITSNLTPLGPINEPNRQAYRLTTGDGNVSVLLNPSSAAIETRAYGRWADFAARLQALVEAVAEVFDPGTEQRFGLRYVDQITRPEGHADWRGLILDELLGVAGHPLLGPGLLGSEQRLALQLDVGLRCLLRHGPLALNDTPWSAYLLDFDLYREDQQSFSPDDVLAFAGRAHDQANRLFRAMITSDLYAILKG